MPIWPGTRDTYVGERQPSERPVHSNPHASFAMEANLWLPIGLIQYTSPGHQLSGCSLQASKGRATDFRLMSSGLEL